MADSVVRLRIDSSEYDNKLRTATTALNRFFDSARQGGQSIANADKSVEDAVRSFGNMAAKAQDARGKLNEMTRAFTEMSMQYKQLTDTEKQSPVGQAMAKSLDQLKGRINETKGQLAEVNKELGNTKTESNAASGSLSSLTQVLGVGVGKLSAYAAAAGAAKVALDVMKDAFMANESLVDEWGRIVDSSKSIYESFLVALNNSDIGGFLHNIDEIVSAARTAYNELDRLGTLQTIQKPAMSAQMTENERMRTMIRTRRYIAPLDGRAAAPGLKTGDLLSPEQIKQIERKLENGMKTVVSLTEKEIIQANRAINAVYVRQAKELGMTAAEFRAGTSSMEEFEKRLELAKKYRDWEANNSYIDVKTGEMVRPRTGNPYAKYEGWDVFRVDGQRYADLVGLITQRDQQMSQAYNMQSRAYQTINRAEGISARGAGGTVGGGKTTRAVVTKTGEVIPEGSIAAYEKEIQELRKAQSYATDTETWKAYAEQIAMVTYEVKKLKGELAAVKTPEQAMADYQSGSITSAQDFAKGFRSTMLDDFRQQAKETAAEQQEAAKKTAEAWSAVGNSVNAVAGALAGLEDPAAQVMGTIAQAIANIALSFSQALLKPKDPFTWIAAAATGTATMISTISAIKSATAGSYATGGIVPGNNHSDGLLAAVSSGELILNAAQQNNIASLLQGGGMSNMHLEAVVSGEQLRFVLNNNSRRRSRGEYVTTLMRN